MRLIEDDAIPLPLNDETLAADTPFIIHDVEVVGRASKVLRLLPCLLRLVGTPHTDPCLLGGLLPLVKSRKGGNQESRRSLRLLDKSQELNCLSQAHLVAENATL